MEILWKLLAKNLGNYFKTKYQFEQFCQDKAK